MVSHDLVISQPYSVLFQFPISFACFLEMVYVIFAYRIDGLGSINAGTELLGIPFISVLA